MAHGYSGGKYRGGKGNRSHSGSGPGRNAQHGKGGHHSQTPKGSHPSRGSVNRGSRTRR